MKTDVTRPPLQLLRESLRADSALRESSIAKLMVGSLLVAIPFIFALALNQSWSSSLGINVFLLLVAGYYVFQIRAMARGWYHPAIAWANVGVEVSIPFVILVMTFIVRGVEYSLMSPVHVVSGAMIITSALRAMPRLSLAAGVLAAAEWVALYSFLLWPNMPENPMPSMRLPSAILRAVILLMGGGFSYLIARHYIRKTEEALQSVREQDLMGKYFLHERLGAGGMAEVYRATYCPEGGFQKPVAIKRVLPTFSKNESFVEMFREEARLCASLNHPNIVQVLDCGRFRDSFILAMEYVDGLPLNRLLRRLSRPLPFNAVAYLAAELASALDYIHRKVDANGAPLHLVHRDVNPPNILISRIGEVKLADFGVANAASRVEAGREDIFYGKIHYAAPEQIVVGPFDGRADLFALGLTLIEAITRKRVYGSDDDAALNKGIFPRIPRASELRPETPPALDELVARLVAHDPARRPATGAEVRAGFCALEGELAPYPGGQQALAKGVEEALAAQDIRSTKPRVTPLPLKEGGERLTEALARDASARRKAKRGGSKSAGSSPKSGSSYPPLVAAARLAPTRDMRLPKSEASPRPPQAKAKGQDAVATQALTDEELQRALDKAASGATHKRPEAAAKAPAPPRRDADEDTQLDDEAPPAAKHKR